MTAGNVTEESLHATPTTAAVGSSRTRYYGRGRRQQDRHAQQAQAQWDYRRSTTGASSIAMHAAMVDVIVHGGSVTSGRVGLSKVNVDGLLWTYSLTITGSRETGTSFRLPDAGTKIRAQDVFPQIYMLQRWLRMLLLEARPPSFCSGCWLAAPWLGCLLLPKSWTSQGSEAAQDAMTGKRPALETGAGCAD